jgi:hypothetical protein
MKVANAGPRKLPTAIEERSKVALAASPELCLTTIVKDATKAPSTQTGLIPVLTPRIAELVTQARAYGSQLRRIQREQFQRAFAASAVAAESAENPQDAQVYDELLRLGRRYGWLE